MQAPLELKGCRHDVLGHYLKAIGLLHVLAKRADQGHCDPDAECTPLLPRTLVRVSRIMKFYNLEGPNILLGSH